MDKKEQTLRKALSLFPLETERFAPGRHIWLTLYLEGDAQAQEKAQSQLTSFGWVNFDEEGEFTGFAYPKREVLNDLAQVLSVLKDALSACQKSKVGVGIIDADTDFDPTISAHINLYKAFD